ncbi:hypothetical protein [Streptococcus suis]|uniref:hypothetical protein n=1 Tax=Streptococcus suis TaxID=1307 RepID=UPI0014791C6F
MIYLTNHRLRVEIAEPGERPNDTFRFDRAGFISNVILDGDTHFCANEPMNLRHLSSGRTVCVVSFRVIFHKVLQSETIFQS